MENVALPMIAHARLNFNQLWALQRDLSPFALTHHGSAMFLCFPAEFVDGIPTKATIERVRNWAEWYLEQIGEKE